MKKKELYTPKCKCQTKINEQNAEIEWLKRIVKKELTMTEKANLINKNEKIPIKRQCELLGISRSGHYYKPKTPSEAAIEREENIKNRIDYWHTKYSYMGHRKILDKLRKDDKIEGIGRRLVLRYMKEMGIKVKYPKPNLSKAGKRHKKFPYLLRNMTIYEPNQVWAVDITYIPMGRKHMYLTAVIDWHSRFIVGWELSETLGTAAVIKALRRAIEKYGSPAIINSDQGSQFTNDEYIRFLAGTGIRQSMDGKSRWADNVVIERWFRSLKIEHIYTSEYETPRELFMGIAGYISDYNNSRPHQNLTNLRPNEVFGNLKRYAA